MERIERAETPPVMPRRRPNNSNVCTQCRRQKQKVLTLKKSGSLDYFINQLSSVIDRHHAPIVSDAKFRTCVIFRARVALELLGLRVAKPPSLPKATPQGAQESYLKPHQLAKEQQKLRCQRLRLV